MPRPKTKPADDELTATKKRLRALRKQSKGTAIEPICNDLLTMIGNIQKYIAADDPVRAEAIRKNLERSTQALAKQVAAMKKNLQ